MDLQTGHLEDRDPTRIILLLFLLFTMKLFCIFFLNTLIQRHLMKDVLL